MVRGTADDRQPKLSLLPNRLLTSKAREQSCSQVAVSVCCSTGGERLLWRSVAKFTLGLSLIVRSGEAASSKWPSLDRLL